MLDAMSDSAVVASAIAVALGLVKVVESLVSVVVKRLTNGRQQHVPTVVQLDQEVSRLMRETHERTATIEQIVSARDSTGAPMVYSPRPCSIDEMKVELRSISENVVEIMRAQDDVADGVSTANERLESIIVASSKKC